MRNKFIILLTFVFTHPAFSQSISEPSKLVVAHKKQKTSFEFVTKEKSIFNDTPDAMVSVPGYYYFSELPDGAGDFDGLPACEKSQVRYIPRADSEDSFTSLDVYVYQFNDSEQKTKAKIFGNKAVPFIEGALANPYRPQGDTGQTIIRALSVRCLPTRIRSVSSNGQKAFEYREGELAWKQKD